MKKTRDIDFICADSQKACGKLRVIDMQEVLEICWLPPKRPERDKKCVVIDRNKLIKFLNKPQ